jgi:hypothetical protein
MNFLHDAEYKMLKSHLKTIIDKLEECEKNIKNTKDQEIYIENKIDVVNKNINLIKDKQNKSYEKIKKYIKLRNDLVLNNENDEMSAVMLKIYNIILYEHDKITDEIDKSRYFQELETLNSELLNLNNLKNHFFEKSEKYKKFIFEIEN